MILHIKTIFILLFTFFSVQSQIIPNLGGQRKGTSAAQFLKIGVGARAEGMGQAFVAIANDATALFWNPAGLTQFDKDQIYFNHTEWLVDTYIENAGIVYHFDSFNTIGLMISYLHMEDMMETTVFQPFGTGRYFTFSDAMFGLSYSRKMTDQFSFGITLKYMQETIAEVNIKSVLFDLGTLYWTGFEKTRFAVSLTNFSSDFVPSGSFKQKNLNNEFIEYSDFQSFAPPTMFRFGIANDFIDNDQHKLTLSVQLNHPNDNHENINLGTEYWWQKFIALRAGYKTAQIEEDFSLGFGIRQKLSFSNLRFDYAYTNFGRLDSVNRFDLIMEF